MESLIQRFEPQRVAIDSLTALDRFAEDGPCIPALAHIASVTRGLATLLTVATPAGADPASRLDPRLAMAADAIIALRLDEAGGELRRTIAVPKLRGSWHERRARTCSIDTSGLHIGPHAQPIAEGDPLAADEDLATAGGFAGRFPGDI
jgi:circadian clock protein KaiC